MGYLDETGLARVWNKVKALIPTRTSDLTNDSGFLTQHQDISGKADKATTYTKTEVDGLLDDKADVEDIPTVPTNVSAFTNDAGYLTEHQDISSKADKTYVDDELAKKVDKVTGKGLSTNDYTTTEKNKLAGIEAGAEVNVIDEDAPNDNKSYGRKNGAWSEITGGGGGTSDYDQLSNRPSINNITLTGNKTSADLDLADEVHSHTVSEITDFPSNLLTNSDLVVTEHQLFADTSITASGTTNGTKTFTKSGYKPIGIVGFRTNYYPVIFSRLYLSTMASGSATVTYGARNNGSSGYTNSVNGFCQILWMKI